MSFSLAQISGALAGGIVGGFAGFVSNSIQQRLQSIQARRSVARALLGEMGAISKRIELEYLKKLSLELSIMKSEGRYPSHRFRGQKDLGRIFCSLGEHLGSLPSELVSELVSWYLSLAIYQERESELHELSSHRSAEFMEYAIELVELQHAGYSGLVQIARPLMTQLSAF